MCSFCGKGYRDLRPDSDLAFEADAAPGLFQDLPGRREPETATVALGGKERLERSGNRIGAVGNGNGRIRRAL